ncbi:MULTISPECIES: hypothetical protein [Bacillus]|uniref:hypothetical protein n=1 Tax=Bacillus TaxID=1386 RepID=UPI000BB963EC|nr:MULTISPECIES: hypothetical protein [Bacillus]
MNEYFASYMKKSIISSLPQEKKMIYKFIEDMEGSYESQAETPEQYFQLLTKNHPYHIASIHFSLPSDEIRRMIQEVEREISVKLDQRLQSACLIDYTSSFNQNDKKFFFYLL